jgi:hypothetical protein
MRNSHTLTAWKRYLHDLSQTGLKESDQLTLSKYLVRTLACALKAPPHTTQYDCEIDKDEQLSNDRCSGGGGGGDGKFRT